MSIASFNPSFAGQVYGFSYPDGVLYSIDSITGDTAVVKPSDVTGFGASSSPVAGQFFLTTGINLWTRDLTGNSAPVGGLLNGGTDLAFDMTTATLYGLDASGLYTLAYSCSPDCLATPLSPLPAGIQGIAFVPGAGVYGVSNFDGMLYRFDPVSQQLTIVGPTLLPPGDGVMDLAYDANAGYFVAAVLPGVLEKTFGQGPVNGSIYRIDRATGSATLLNGNAPSMFAVAETIPEPSSGVLILPAFAALLAMSRRRTGRTPWPSA